MISEILPYRDSLKNSNPLQISLAKAGQICAGVNYMVCYKCCYQITEAQIPIPDLLFEGECLFALSFPHTTPFFPLS